jgi:hypothetical protein
MSEKFTSFIQGAPTRTLDGTELVPLVTSVPNTQQNTLANIALFIQAPVSENLTSANNGDTLGIDASIYYVTMDYEGYDVVLPTSASMTNRTLIFITVSVTDEGGVNIYANGDDTIQGSGSSYTISGSGGNVTMLSDGQGNWWVLNTYYA